MKKSILVFGVMVVALSAATAQEYKVAKNSGRLQIYLGNVAIEGSTGNEIVFSSNDFGREKDERAKGLTAVNSMGLTDNTGLGINVADKGDVIEVRQLKKMNSPSIKIQVPKGVVVAYDYSSPHCGEVKIKNLENELDISANFNSVELENVTGPMTVKSVHGHVDADLNANVKGPVSIVSVHGYVDVALPLATKADIKMSTSHGEIYAAEEFKIEFEKVGDRMIRYDDKVSGKINGGGTKIELSSNHGKVYLRKK